MATIKTKFTIEEDTERLIELVQELTEDPTDQLDLFASLLDYTEEHGFQPDLKEWAGKELTRIRSLNLPRTQPGKPAAESEDE